MDLFGQTSKPNPHFLPHSDQGHAYLNHNSHFFDDTEDSFDEEGAIQPQNHKIQVGWPDIGGNLSKNAPDVDPYYAIACPMCQYGQLVPKRINLKNECLLICSQTNQQQFERELYDFPQLSDGNNVSPIECPQQFQKSNEERVLQMGRPQRASSSFFAGGQIHCRAASPKKEVQLASCTKNADQHFPSPPYIGMNSDYPFSVTASPNNQVKGSSDTYNPLEVQRATTEHTRNNCPFPFERFGISQQLELDDFLFDMDNKDAKIRQLETKLRDITNNKKKNDQIKQLSDYKREQDAESHQELDFFKESKSYSPQQRISKETSVPKQISKGNMHPKQLTPAAVTFSSQGVQSTYSTLSTINLRVAF